MYITNSIEVAQIAEAAGVDRIFVDMEYIGKADRQGGMDTVQSRHTLQDIQNVRKNLHTAELLVRCNPIHDATESYDSSKDEIDGIIASGADIIMLPYFKTAQEVSKFVSFVNGRVKTMLLFETPEAVEQLETILQIKGVDEVYIGLNDLSLGYHRKFMFELLTDGTVEKICHCFRKSGLPYGFGGIASVGKGMLPAEKIIREHYRLGSTSVILSRSFCNVETVGDMEEIKQIFQNGVKAIRNVEAECEQHAAFFWDNQMKLKEAVAHICQ